jgi:hypothetical protein
VLPGSRWGAVILYRSRSARLLFVVNDREATRINGKQEWLINNVIACRAGNYGIYGDHREQRGVNPLIAGSSPRPTHVRGHFLTGHHCRSGGRGGKLDPAMTTSDADRTISPQSAFNLGVQREMHGDCAGATAAYQAAIASGHSVWTPRAAYALGRLRGRRFDYAGAAAAYWIAIDSGHTDVRFGAAVGLGHLHVEIPADPAAAELINRLKLAEKDYAFEGRVGRTASLVDARPRHPYRYRASHLGVHYG